jgi:glycosyltransferase involved in cell wall biosynthesis
MISDVDVGLPNATRTHTLEIARGLATEGFDVELVARGPDPAVEGVRFHSAANGKPPMLQRVLGVNRRAAGVLWRSRRSASACYVRHDWGLLPALLISRLLGYRLVTEVNDVPHGPGYEIRQAGARGLLTDYVKRGAAITMGQSAAHVVAVTKEIRTLLVRDHYVPPQKVHVLPNGVDLDVFAPLPREEALRRRGLDPGCRYVVFTGNFAPWVDFDTMLEAFAIAAATRPWARLLLVGDGPERDHVAGLTARLGIGSQVEVTGYVEDPHIVSELVAAGTVCLVANRAEYRARTGASPVKVAEYLGSGRAVVGVGLAGTREMIEQNGAGIAVSADASAMAEAIAELLDDPERADALGVRGRRAAELRYSWRSIVERTAALLRDGGKARGS